ncbi:MULTISPECIES: hypothetical protein [unclassified Flavobacterium]|uniref:hypothetical protein n=1 Tax=unclassified Flavobacterium TaxID=196869 RepID=UPI0013D791FA|nr:MULTISPECIES: hypothetical protein [unclassified Flavobacterium]MBA5792535.1 hypothetical protein [Flavobacterium sp. xlx-221]
MNYYKVFQPYVITHHPTSIIYHQASITKHPSPHYSFYTNVFYRVLVVQYIVLWWCT